MMTSSQSFSGGCPESGPLGVSGSRSATIDPLTGNSSVSGESYINTGGNAQSPVRRSGTQEISAYDDPPNDKDDCPGTIHFTSTLSGENTTAMMVANGKSKLKGFTGTRQPGTPFAYRNVHKNELFFDYQKTQFQFRWKPEVTAEQRGPVTCLLVFQPEDNPDTKDIDESTKNAEVVETITWDGTSGESRFFTIDPDQKKSGVDGNYRLASVDIDFIHPATGEMDESRETSEGGYIAIRRDEQTPVTKLKLRKLDGIANAQFKLVFSSSKMKLWKDAGRTQAVESDSTTFPGNQDTDLFFEGVEKSSAAKDIEIGLKVKIGSTEETAAKARATVVQAEFPVILRAFIPYKWTQPLEEYEGWSLPPIVNYTIAAEGDNRGLALTEQNVTFRVRQKINITPYADLSTATDIVNKRVADKALISRHYDKNMAVPIGERSGIHGYNLIDGIQPRDSGEPTLPVKTFEFKTRASSRNITYYLELSGEDGALPWYVPAFAAPNIDWKYDIKVDCTDPAKPKINVKGERDGFPAYEILVTTSDGTIKEIYYWRPTVNVQVGFGPLTTPISIDETLEVP
jgi:hypothetical protein